MSDLEQRIARLEDHAALQQLVTDYLIAVDDLTDIEPVLALFTDNAVFDMRGIGYPHFEGKPALRDFFTDVFSSMSHHAHYATNFSVDSLEGNNARCRTHVIGMGRTNDNAQVLFYLQYHLTMKRNAAGRWQISLFKGKALMPL